YFRRVVMAPNKEVLDRRDPIVESGEGHFVVLGPGRVDYQALRFDVGCTQSCTDTRPGRHCKQVASCELHWKFTFLCWNSPSLRSTSKSSGTPSRVTRT